MPRHPILGRCYSLSQNSTLTPSLKPATAPLDKFNVTIAPKLKLTARISR